MEKLELNKGDIVALKTDLSKIGEVIGCNLTFIVVQLFPSFSEMPAVKIEGSPKFFILLKSKRKIAI